MATTKQPERLIELERRLRSWESLIETGGDSDRDTRYELIDAYVRGYHSGAEDDGVHGRDKVKLGDEWYPAVPLCWMVIDMIIPKILNAPVDPQVIPEQDSPFYQPVDSPFMRYKRDNGLVTRSDADAAAEMLSAAIEHHTEKLGFKGKMRDAWVGAAWFGDYFIYDENEDGGPDAACVHPSRIKVDPDAVDFDTARVIVMETDATLAWVRKNYEEYGHLVNARSTNDRRNPVSHETEALREEDNNVVVKCFFEKSLEVTTKTESEKITDPAEYQELLESDEWELVDVAYQETPSGVIPVWTFEREYETEENPGGWVKHVECNGVVLADSLPVSDSGELPLHHVYFYKVPNRFWSMGVVDIVQDLNVIYDDILKNCLDDIEQNGPVNFIRGAELESEVDQVDDSRTKTYEVKGGAADSPLSNVLHHQPAGETSQSALRILDVVRQLIEVITGQVDPRTSTGPLREASGAMVREMEDGSHERLGPQQELNQELQCAIVKNWCYQLITSDEGPRSYRRKTNSGREYLRFNAGIFGSKDFDFYFDVITGDATAVPRKANERSAWYTALVSEVMALPQEIADWRIDISGAPNGHELKQLVARFREAQAQQGGPSPADIEAQNNTRKSLADSLEELVKDDRQPQGIKAMALAALHEWSTTGQVPDISPLLGLLTTQPMIPEGTGINGPVTGAMYQ